MKKKKQTGNKVAQVNGFPVQAVYCSNCCYFLGYHLATTKALAGWLYWHVKYYTKTGSHFKGLNTIARTEEQKRCPNCKLKLDWGKL